MTIRIERWNGAGRPDDFLSIPARVYAGNPYAMATADEVVLAALQRPEFNAHQSVWVATDQGKPQARVVARLSPTMRGSDGRPVGMLGFFEALPHTDAVRALFDDALGWLQHAGAGTVLGPMDGDTWHKYRLNVGPHDSPPFLMEPFNPDSYPALWEANGFTVAERYYSKVVDDAAAAARDTSRVAARAQKRYRLRPLQRDRLADELAVIHTLSCRIFEQNRFYTPISLPDFRALYAGVDALLEEGCNWFAQDEAGQDVGFVFAFPDRFRAIQAMRGKRDLWAKLRYLRHARSATAVNIKTLGVLPEHQRTGVAMALMHAVYAHAAARGYRHVNLCLIREGNASGRMDGGIGRPLRHYALYARTLP